jgi:hypothetical protein
MQAEHNNGILMESGCIDPRLLDLGTVLWSVVSFELLPPYRQERASGHKR